MEWELLKLKQKIVCTKKLCSGNISEDFSEDNMKKMGLWGTVYDFSVNYYPITLDDILDVHKYLMKKSQI